MARGYPDRFGVQQFPQYGTTYSNTDTVNATANDYKTILSVSGKGIFYGTRIKISGAATVENDNIRIEIDGNLIFEHPIGTIAIDRDADFAGALVGVTRFDNTNYAYNIWIRGDIPFTSSFVVKYKETYGRTPSITHWAFYTLVQ